MPTEVVPKGVKYRFRSDRYSSLTIQGPLVRQLDPLTQAQVQVPGLTLELQNGVLDIRDNADADGLRDYVRRTIHYVTGEIYEVPVKSGSVPAPTSVASPDPSGLKLSLPGMSLPVTAGETLDGSAGQRTAEIAVVEEVASRNDAIAYLVGRFNANPKGWPRNTEEFLRAVEEKYQVRFPNLS